MLNLAKASKFTFCFYNRVIYFYLTIYIMAAASFAVIFILYAL